MTDIPTRKLEFLPEIEQQAIVIVTKDQSFLVKWKNRLKVDHWNEPHIQVIFKIVDEHTTKYKELPTISIIKQELLKHLSVYDALENFVRYIDEIFTKNYQTEEKYTKDCLMDHMKAVDYDRFIIEAAKLISQKNHKSIPKLLEEITVRHTLAQPVDAYLSTEAESVVARVTKEKTLKAGVKTPWATFNAKHGGGFQVAALSAFMGPTGSGKSINLVNVGACCVLNGLNVYHFTFELSAEKTKARYDVCIGGVSSDERRNNPQILDDALKKIKDKGTMGKLYVIQHPTGTASANTVRGSLNDYLLLGGPKPDVIILDYLTIMLPNDPDNVDMKRDYAKLKQIAEEVRAIAMEMDIPIVTALQSNRNAASKEKIGKEDIADSYAVMHVLDCVLTLNQTEAEKQMGKMRLYASKVRDFDDCYTIMTDVDYKTLRISEDSASTMNYNAAVAKATTAAIAKAASSGTLAIQPPFTPDSPEAGMESLLGASSFGTHSVKAKNAVVQLTQGQQAENAAWGMGLQPPPIATPK
jgi:replicative DNA helicase